jgi:hypothetical protein
MDQLWEIEADAIMNKNKCSAEMVRTFVILRWMYLKGDLRPLADAILKRHEIDKAVLNALALMILEDDAVPANLKDLTPSCNATSNTPNVSAEQADIGNGGGKGLLH